MNVIELLEDSVKNVTIQSEKSDLPTWSQKMFKKAMKIKVIKMDESDMEFDIIDVHCSFVNAFRRVLLAEVPMMAIEKVYIINNTSIIQDEVLSHRLGLIPLKADPRKFNFRKADDDEPFSPEDSLEFHLKVKCTRNSKAHSSKSTSVQDPFKDCNNIKVLSKQLKWVPIGDQGTQFTANDVGPVEDEILLAKLRPGHELDLKLFAVKGIGKDHAKFQPVATAFYRLLPQITLLEEINGEKASRLKDSFSPGVIKLEEKKGKVTARVADARLDTCSRNVFRHEDLKDSVALSRVPNHFIFTIESVGALKPEELFIEAIRVLKDKCDRILEEIKSKGETCFM